MQRFPDWPRRFWQAIHDRRAIPHVWGQSDCALYAADLVKAMTGEDLASRFRGTYDSEAGAAATLEAQGWESLADMADAFLDRCERPARGDIVLLPGLFGPYLAVCVGGRWAYAPEHDRPRPRPIDNRIAAWKV
jgi:hypothetical protein